MKLPPTGIWLRLFTCITLVFAFTPNLVACLCDEKVEITFHGYMCAETDYTIEIPGEGVPATGVGNDCNAYADSTEGSAKIEPLTEYTFSVTGSVCSTHVKINHPGCYDLYIKGGGTYADWTKTDAIDKGSAAGAGDGDWQIMLVPSGAGGEVGEGYEELGSVKFRLGLGKLNEWQPAGFLYLYQEDITANSYSPAALRLALTPNEESDVQVLRDSQNGNAIRQIDTPQAFVDITTINASRYEVRFYDPATPKTLSGGFYVLTNPSAPSMVTWVVENPGTVGGSGLRITELRSGASTEREFIQSTDTSGNALWKLKTGNGSRVKAQLTTYVGGDRVKTITTADALGVVASKRQEIYRTFAWGDEVIARIEDPDGAAARVDYTYHTNAAAPESYRRLKTELRPDGSWSRYDYSVSPDTGGLVVKRYSPFIDGPETEVEATDSNSRLSTTIRTLGVDVRDTTEVVLGTQLSASSYYFGWGSVIDGRSSAITSVQTSMSANYGAGVAQNLITRPTSVTTPEGRYDSYSYEFGSYNQATRNFTVGAGGAVRTRITRASTANPSGVANRSTQDVQIRNAAGHLVAEQTYLTTDGATFTTLLTQTFYDYDQVGRLKTITKDGRVVRDITWNDATRTKVEVDETGGKVTHVHNALGQIVTETREGVALAGEYAAQPDVVTTYTYDAEGRVKETSRSAGGLTLTTSSSYDLRGRPTLATDENGLTTSWEYPDELTTQMTRPDGGTEITTRYLDGQVKSVTGSGVVPRFYTYAVDPGTQSVVTTEYIGSSDATSPRWVRTETDGTGRVRSVTRPGFSGGNVVVESNTYSFTTGLLARQEQAGLAPRLYVYDEFGELSQEGLDIDGNGLLTAASADRFAEASKGYLLDSGAWYRFSRTSGYFKDNNATATVIGERREQTSGLAVSRLSKEVNIDARGNQVITTRDLNVANKLVTSTTVVPGASNTAVSVVRNGLLQTQTTPSVVVPAKFGYDGLGRLTTSTDARGATTTTVYFNGKNQVQSVADHLNQTTSFTYYQQGEAGAGQQKTQTNADNSVQRFAYDQQGRRVRVWGDSPYPTEYGYNIYGELNSMSTYRADVGWNSATWPGGGATADTTTWQIQASTGLLQQKLDATSKGASYTYHDTADNRIHTRAWQRGTVTTYGYSPGTGELSSVTYSDGTPGVILTYDRQGRLATVSDGAGVRSLTHDVLGNPLTETFNGGLLNGFSVSRAYDGIGRKVLTASRSAGSKLNGWGNTYYPADGRLQDVIAGNVQVRYTYEVNGSSQSISDLASGMTFQRAGALRLSTVRHFDTIGRLDQITHVGPANTVLSGSNTTLFDAMNRRKRRSLESGSYWEYAYNSRGEVTGADKHLPDATYYAGWQFGYQYDAIGNRLTTSRGGDPSGANQRSFSYTPNSLNQYQSWTVPGYFDVLGESKADATVTVNAQAVTHQGTAWRSEVAVDNSAAPVATTVDVQGSWNTQTAPAQTGTVYVPKASQDLTTQGYDDDGNLLRDGRFRYTWDGENRLASVQTLEEAELAGASGLKSTFVYDFSGRRVSKTFHTATGTPGAYTFTAANSIRFLYDGWNLISEVDDAGSLIRGYTWGKDLSGSEQGAGGVGGLLLVGTPSTAGGASGYYATAYDEMGNVTALVDTASGAIEAKYEYGPFGETLRVTGGMGELNPFRFSTKYQDKENGLLYYGYRYYQSATGRWLSKDPLEETGGSNLYDFARNNPLSNIDRFGLDVSDFSNPQWHHRLVQAQAKFFKSVGLKIHSPEFGWILEAKDHAELNAGYDRAWREYIRSLGGTLPDADEVLEQMRRIEQQFEHILSRGEQATVSYWRWRGTRQILMGAKLKSGAKVAGKLTKVLTIYAVVTAFQEARAAGKSYDDALNEASMEVINITPWSVRELVEKHEEASDFEAILEASQEAYSRGNNLFNGHQGPDVIGSRSQLMREYLFECR